MNSLTSSNNTPLKISRFLIGVYIAYNVFLVPIGFYVPRLSIVLLFLAGTFALFSTKIKVSLEFRCLLFFIVYAFVSGLLVAIDRSVVVNKIVSLAETFVVGIIVFSVTKDEKDLRQIIGMFAIGAVIMGVFSFFRLDYLYSASGRLSLDEDFNSNTFGIMLTYGVWSVVFFLYNEKVSFVRIAVIVFCSLLLFYTIIQTGSRKSAVGSLLILVSYALFVFLGRKGTSKGNTRVYIIPLFIGLVAFVYYRYLDVFLERSETLMSRMETLELSGEGRWSIIKEAFRVWLEHPLVGVGMDNVRYYTIMRMYSHNSYVEALACSGIFGFALLFPIYWRMIVYFFSNIWKIKKVFSLPSVYFICILIVFYLVVCFTQINIYNPTHMYITYFILVFISINKNYNEKNSQPVV